MLLGKGMILHEVWQKLMKNAQKGLFLAVSVTLNLFIFWF
ncbi:hypothetical protein HMPREF9554_02367 [Treponema phagedenis F0421]|nr:hypothetical protein HMPREF9554_02367 [Treponema phagedenis F0421]